MSAMKLDCENEKSSPIHMPTIAISAAITARGERENSATTRLARIATTRKRP